MNAQGIDILRRDGYVPPRGDIRYTSEEGPSRLIDIDVTDSEIYSVLDAKEGVYLPTMVMVICSTYLVGLEIG